MKKTKRSDQTAENFYSALNKLEEFLGEPIVNDRDRAGIIQAFEFCYELSWQAIKKLAENEGLDAPTPLQAFQAGFQMKLIPSEAQETWLDMKKSRNLTSHTYKEEVAEEVLQKINQAYLKAFQDLARTLRR